MAETQTLVSLLERAAGYPNAGLRLLDRQERAQWYPWSEIVRRARRVAGGLQDAGVRGGECIALVYPTCVEFFDAFFGVLLAAPIAPIRDKC